MQRGDVRPGRRCRAAGSRLWHGHTGFRTGPVLSQPQCNGVAVVEHLDGAVGVDEDGRRVPGTGVHQFTGVGVEHRADGGRALGAGQPRSEAVHSRESGTGAWVVEQQGPAGTAHLTHHGGCRKAMADAVADNQRDAPVLHVDDVIPVTAHLQGSAGGLIAHREAGRQISGAEDCVLQRQGGFALLINLMHPLQALAETACQHA